MNFNSFNEFINFFCTCSYDQWHVPLLNKSIFAPILNKNGDVVVDCVVMYEMLEHGLKQIAKEKFDKSCLDATSKYINRKDIGIDFRTVYQAAIRLIGRNNYEELAIFHSANPGERLYKKGCEDPGIKAKLDLEENQELLKNMGNRKVDKDSLTGGTKVKSDEFFTPQEIINMTPLEAKDELPKIEKSVKHWEEHRKQK